MLEHARFRCLSSARSVLQGDVDELVLADKGRSVFDLAERSVGGYLRYGGLWRRPAWRVTILFPPHGDTAEFSAGGDSGSVILVEGMIGGLLFAGGGGVTIANRISHVISLLGVRL